MATLTVLGGSPAGAGTGRGCSGYLISTDEATFVLDLGPGTLTELRRHADFRTLDAVILSHLHVDHVLDLVALRFALAYNPVRPPGLVPLRLPPGGEAFLDRVADAFAEPGKAGAFFPDVFDIDEYDPASVLTIGDARLTFAPTVHYVPCWAIRIAHPGGGRALVYTADTGPAADLAGFVAGCGVMVAESTLLEPSEEPFSSRGHLTAEEAAGLARTAGAETLVLTHTWEERGVDRYREQAEEHFGGQLLLAEPGLTLEW